jgi:nucleoside-diphosphate kinase
MRAPEELPVVGPCDHRSNRKDRTLLLIKPDGVRRRLVGQVIARVEKERFEIAAMKMTTLSEETATSLYRAHKGKPFYLPLIDFITSGPVVALVLLRDDAVRRLRKVVGATDPSQARRGTLRAELGTDVQKNVVHAAETGKDAEREIGLVF